jgi:hypothetical protein
MIASLDVEEKARAKDTSSNGGEGHSSANTTRVKGRQNLTSTTKLPTSRRRRRRRRMK